MKPTITWIVVADGSRAKIYVNRGRGKGIELLEHEISSEHPRTSEMVRDGLYRTHESVGHSRHAIEPKSDPHRELKRDFAQVLAEMLDRRASEKSFDKWVLVAPPGMLGDLRQATSRRLRGLLRFEIAKDLTKASTHEVAGHLAEMLII
jgi:protein required for attachment to host cells